MFRFALLVGAIAVGMIFASPAVAQEDSTVERVDRALDALMLWYSDETGLWETTNWWNAANALYVVIDAAMRTGSDRYDAAIATTFAQSQFDQFLNEFYDDEGWWALTWIHAFDLTGEARYLDMAKVIFEDMTTGWDEVCGGGIWWKKDRQYKNAIPNSLFMLTAAKLYNRTDDYVYLDWAQRDWAWFQASDMINELNLVNDGLEDCANNRGITWTYNQGVLIGALVELYAANDDMALIEQATAIADASITLIIEDGVLREPCELAFNCGADGPQFKGVFMRHLRSLYDVTGHVRYRDFITLNADTLWDKARNDADQIGLRWGARHDRADAARQTSALDALLVAVR
ncbi:MAG: glycoside hydrolase family 76 protein [Chloroflexota bacterium]|nr:glycoside hydrolase family 76 protein [Chloroflexota bacterium]